MHFDGIEKRLNDKNYANKKSLKNVDKHYVC